MNLSEPADTNTTRHALPTRDAPLTRDTLPTRLYRPLAASPVRRGVALFVLVCLIKLAQAPQAFFLPTLHFEDGRDMFAFYLNHPEFSNVFRFYAGYISIPANVVGYFASKVDPVATPYVYGVVSLCWCAATYVMLASSRMRHLLPGAGTRFAVALLVAAMPIGDYALLSVNDYSKWHQLWLFILLLISLPPATKFGQAVEVLALLLLAWVNPAGISCAWLLIPALLLRPTRAQRAGLFAVALSILAYARWGVDWSVSPPIPIVALFRETGRLVFQRVVFEGAFGNSARIWLILHRQNLFLYVASLTLVFFLLRALYNKRRALGREGRIVVCSLLVAIFLISLTAERSGRADLAYYGHRYVYVQQIAFLTLLFTQVVGFLQTTITFARPRLLVTSGLLLTAAILISNLSNRENFLSPPELGRKILTFTQQVSNERDPRTRTIPRDQAKILEFVKDGTWSIRVDIPPLEPAAHDRDK